MHCGPSTRLAVEPFPGGRVFSQSTRSRHRDPRERAGGGPELWSEVWSDPSLDRIGRALSAGTRRQRRRRRIILAGLGIVVVAALAVFADAYYQSYSVYRELRQVLPTVKAARASMALGKLPSDLEMARLSDAAERARAKLDGARPSLRLVDRLPGLRDPI